MVDCYAWWLCIEAVGSDMCPHIAAVGQKLLTDAALVLVTRDLKKDLKS